MNLPSLYSKQAPNMIFPPINPYEQIDLATLDYNYTQKVTHELIESARLQQQLAKAIIKRKKQMLQLKDDL